MKALGVLLLKGITRAIAVLVAAFVLCLCGCPPLNGQNPAIANSTCLACHDGRSAPDKTDFNLGLHVGVRCEDCHGSGYTHVRNAGRNGLFINNPEDAPFLPSMDVCARCHEDMLEGHLATGHGTSEAVSCHVCHDIHRANAMTVGVSKPDRLTNGEYAQLCGQCHAVEVEGFLKSVHAQTNAVSCVMCHEMHTPTTFPASPIDNRLCQRCHSSFILGLETDEDVDVHTGAFHPVDPAGTGASRCIGCHMPPLSQDPGATSDHSMFTVPPAFTLQQLDQGVIPPPPNSCAGVAGCHDASVAGSGQPHDPNSRATNENMQLLYELTGDIP